MRTAKRPDLEDVRGEFEALRSGPRRRRVPERLWRAAYELLDRHGPTLICRELRISATRFKRFRDRMAGERRSVSAAGNSHGRPARPKVKASAEGAGRRPVAFVEMPPLSIGPRLAPTSPEARRTPGECRLVVENADGTRLTIVGADRALVAAMCRLVLDGHAVLDAAGS